MREQMEKWLTENPDATAEEIFTAGWMKCTEEWCHHRREKMEQCIELMKEIIG